MLPFKGKNRVTSPFGPRSGGNHAGIDIVGDDNRIVYAVDAGRVAASTMVTNKKDRTWEWGNYARVDLPDGTRHYYCHMDSRAVNVGQTVNAGDMIGVMGNTGYSFGAHLHFEVRNKFGVPINPAEVLGIKNAVGITTALAPEAQSAHESEEDGNMYRLYQVVSASLSLEQAAQEAENIRVAGGRPGISRASSDGKYRVGNCVFANPNFATVLAQFKDAENTFVG